jgi:hypothetical protein
MGEEKGKFSLEEFVRELNNFSSDVNFLIGITSNEKELPDSFSNRKFFAREYFELERLYYTTRAKAILEGYIKE